ncbi:hypothetical protein BN8_p06825 (plasmid) [Fibrisoma limi BUZ 3]|uniref:Nucleotidyltransferase n=1 Tax=Fibrisoma limi BUZ 3 TaxID=1185876 RepID=I2GU28_9BACT|nr:CBASS oligonucleotide cyclase [Fibrisoma limi]CCH57629.1 hypothetical protein BN8_p06825 [Fibrisoma limi BUZ 3]
MNQFSYHRNTLHRRLTCFVNWIRPEDETIDQIAAQADFIRSRIKAKAIEDSLLVTATPHSGSFAKRTGLRRHMRGHAEVEGQDVDIPFVVAPKDAQGEKLTELLDRFARYADSTYPDTAKEPTKSSIKLKFSNRLFFDIVPMLSTGRADEQIIIRSNGDRLKTSIEKHVAFVRARTKSSDALAGRVQFNECVRLMKWWRESQSVDNYYFGNGNLPSSMLIDLLCAKAYDELSVCTTYAETLARWFSLLASLVKQRKPIFFSDVNTKQPADESAEWCVFDPVNPENNVVKKWGYGEVNELADWLAKGRDEWARAIRFNEDGEDSKSMDSMVRIFGNAFRNHCD